MKLTPEIYRCRDHDVDLTDAVEDQLELVPVAFARETKRPQPFEVKVTCPGDGHRHRLTFEGTYTR